MGAKFARFVESLHPSFERLMSMTPISDGILAKDMPLRGVYLYSEGDRPLYVGRTNNLRVRHRGHSGVSSTHHHASFAFKLAREATGFLKSSYKAGAEDTRKKLMENPAFIEAFEAAKTRVRAMNYRFVEEADPTRQALLEIYVTVVLGTPYNDFDNH